METTVKCQRAEQNRILPCKIPQRGSTSSPAVPCSSCQLHGCTWGKKMLKVHIHVTKNWLTWFMFNDTDIKKNADCIFTFIFQNQTWVIIKQLHWFNDYRFSITAISAGGQSKDDDCAQTFKLGRQIYLFFKINTSLLEWAFKK